MICTGRSTKRVYALTWTPRWMLTWTAESVVHLILSANHLYFRFLLEFAVQINCIHPSVCHPRPSHTAWNPYPLSKPIRSPRPSSWFVHRKEWPLRIPGSSTLLTTPQAGSSSQHARTSSWALRLVAPLKINTIESAYILFSFAQLFGVTRYRLVSCYCLHNGNSFRV